ncbi:MAG: hypothetical protein JWL77_6772, partial [Chthonomonadaceae bacterium]|nr:hypothetical protein [Chthonomonadaceae bacterium]
RNRGQEDVPNIAHTAAGHNISRLVGLTDLAERPGYDPKLWGRLAQWQTSWRYAHDTPERVQAEAFLMDVRTASNWLAPKIVKS